MVTIGMSLILLACILYAIVMGIATFGSKKSFNKYVPVLTMICIVCVIITAFIFIYAKSIHH